MPVEWFCHPNDFHLEDFLIDPFQPRPLISRARELKSVSPIQSEKVGPKSGGVQILLCTRSKIGSSCSLISAGIPQSFPAGI
jgi:hypothetical protein